MEERPMEECCPLFHGLSLGDFDEKHPTPDAPLTPANVREAVIAVWPTLSYPLASALALYSYIALALT